MLWTDPFAPFTAQARAAFLPPADVTVSEGDIVLTMDLPGLTAQDLTIELAEGSLCVRGERPFPQVAQGSRRVHGERGFGRFERRIQLPDGIDPDRITASMDHGVLSLIVPKPERMVPRTIEIGSGDDERRLEAGTA
jgi:HSP20 family protein